MRSLRHDNTHAVRAPSGNRSAFTLIELLVAVAIIAVLLGLLVVGVRAASLAGRSAADQATVRSMAIGVNAFRDDFGFLPPLVHDGGAMSVPRPQVGVGMPWPSSPIANVMTLDNNTKLTPAVYSQRLDANFFRGRDLGGTELLPLQADQRYSKFSLTYYLAGALGRNVDGVDGPGMVAVERNGAFRGVQIAGGFVQVRGRRRADAFFDPDSSGASIRPDYWDVAEYREHALPAPTVLPPGLEFSRGIVDANGKAFRYYRWEPETTVTSTRDLNVPRVLLDHEVAEAARLNIGDPTLDATRNDPRVRGARWAVVGAGPDGLFGTEAPGDLVARYGGPANMAVDSPQHLQLKAQAQADNAVEVGR